MLRMIRVAVCMAVVVALPVLGALAVPQGSITIDHIDGASGPNTLCVGSVKFNLRLTLSSAGTGVQGLSNGFRIYSTDGAVWQNLRADTLNGVFASFNVSKIINYFSADGAGADTIGFLAIAIQNVLPAGYNQIAFQIALDLPPADAGKSICLDSCFFPPGGTWTWTSSDLSSASPSWPGSNCYSIYDCSTQPDGDGDGIGDQYDDCPTHYNPAQEDRDADGKGDSCDVGQPLFSALPVGGRPPLLVQFSDQSIPISSIDSWLWKFGDGATSTSQNPVHTYSTFGKYDVTLVITRGALIDSLCKTGYIQIDSQATGYFVDTVYTADIFSVRAGDFDLDNNQDLLWISFPLTGIQGIYASWGRTNGGVDAPLLIASLDTFQTFAGHITDGYVNDDSLLDLIVSTYAGVHVLLNDGARAFHDVFTQSSGALISTVGTGYLNNDAFLDLIVSPGEILFGDGTGHFPTSQFVSGSMTAVDIADFNNDGRDDFVAVNQNGYAVVMINNGNGTFTQGGAMFTGGTDYSVTTNHGVADFNRDGNVDLATVSWLGGCTGCLRSSMVSIGFGDGTGYFITNENHMLGGYSVNVVSSDFNRDGYLDIAASEAGPDTIVVWYGDGTGSFPDSSIVPTPMPNGAPWALECADLNRDGNPDLITGNTLSSGTSPIWLLYSNLPPAPVLPPEMVATATTIATNENEVSAVDFTVMNPTGFEISRQARTVAGSSYGRLDTDTNGKLDVRTYDYNLVDGEYRIVVHPNPAAGQGGSFTMDIRVDGSQQARIFESYAFPFLLKQGASQSDSLVFYYTVESTPSMSPPNGRRTRTQTPSFEFAKLTDTTNSTRYQIQISSNYDLSTPLYNDSTLTKAQFLPPAELDTGKVYYWRGRSYKGSWSGWTRTMAAYIGPGCCQGFTGNVNTLGIVDGADLASLVSYLTGGGFSLPCTDEANVNGSGIVDGADLAGLVSYLTGGGFVLPSCP